jgi:hypothetical protein
MKFMNMSGCYVFYGCGMLLQFKLKYTLQILAEHSYVLCMQHRLYLQWPFIAGYVFLCIFVDMLKTVHLFAYSLSIV